MTRRIDAHVRVFLYPSLTNQTEADRLIARLAWYLKPHFAGLDRIVLSSPPQLIASASVAADLDPRVKTFLDETKPFIQIVQRQDLEKAILEGDFTKDILLLWDVRCEALLSAEMAYAIGSYKKNSGFYRIDHERTRMEGSFLLWAGLNKFCDIPALIVSHKQRLARMAREIGVYTRAYVFGTGPTFSDFVSQHDFSDGLSIIANSIVKDKEALALIKPKIICAADPIYHAGVSSYAAAFREELIDALHSTGAWFVCPMRDFPIYDTFLPDALRERVVALPFDNKLPPPTDLLQSFYLHPYPNVLTLALLPLASTFANRISVIGCDGRKIVDDKFFWSHDKKVQFVDKMAEIQAAHPAFFKIDYNDYYIDHCRDLEVVISTLEKAGRHVESLTRSIIPALDHRHNEPMLADDIRCFAMLDPDAKDDWGHFLAYDKRLGDAVTQRNLDYALICRTELAAKFHPGSAAKVLRNFTVHSWVIGNKTPPKRSEVLVFARELDSALHELETIYSDGDIALFFYVGSVESAEVIEHIVSYRRRFRAVVNLFWSYNFDQSSEAYRATWQPILRRQSVSQRVSLTHSTHQITEDFVRDWDLYIPVLQHPSTTFSDDEANRLASAPPILTTKRPYRVLFPGGARKEKGFTLSIESCSILAKDKGITPILRARLDKVSGAELHRAYAALKKDGIEILDGDLSDPEFVRMISDADIVVIPYRGEAFRRRTSGILVDAMLVGTPVIVLEGTWLSDIVKADGIGLVCEANAPAVVSAVQQILVDRAPFLEAIKKQQKAYLHENSWLNLVDAILELATKKIDVKAHVENSLDLFRARVPRSSSVSDAELQPNASKQSFSSFSHRTQVLHLTARLLTSAAPEEDIHALRNLVSENGWDERDEALRHATKVIDFIKHRK